MHCFTVEFVEALQALPKYTPRVVQCDDGTLLTVWISGLGLRVQKAPLGTPVDVVAAPAPAGIEPVGGGI